LAEFRLALIGEPDAPETRAAARLLRELAPGTAPHGIAALPQLLRLAAEGMQFDLIVVAQSWPAQFSREEVLALIRAAPLARLVCCYGPWCDSDGRNGTYWPAGCRVPLAGARTRLARALGMAGAAPAARNAESPRSREALLPLTASRNEVFDYDFAAIASPVAGSPAVAVNSPDAAWLRMIDRALRAAGCRLTTPRAASVLVFDADPFENRATEIPFLLREHGQAAIVACLGFPRLDLEDQLRDFGAAACWFKLAPLATLAALVNRAAAGRGPPTSCGVSNRH
jgi:hypothetical protein